MSGVSVGTYVFKRTNVGAGFLNQLMCEFCTTPYSQLSNKIRRN